MEDVLLPLFRENDRDADSILATSTRLRAAVEQLGWEELTPLVEAKLGPEQSSAGHGLQDLPSEWRDVVLESYARRCSGDRLEGLVQVCMDHSAIVALATCVLRSEGRLDHTVLKRVHRMLSTRLDQAERADRCAVLSLLLAFLCTSPDALVHPHGNSNIEDRLFSLLDDADEDVVKLSAQSLSLLPRNARQWSDLLNKLQRELDLILTEMRGRQTAEDDRRRELLPLLRLSRRFSAVASVAQSLLSTTFAFPGRVNVEPVAVVLAEAMRTEMTPPQTRASAGALLATLCAHFPPASLLPVARRLITAVCTALDSPPLRETFLAAEAVITALGLAAMKAMTPQLGLQAVELISVAVHGGAEEPLPPVDATNRDVSRKRRRKSTVKTQDQGGPLQSSQLTATKCVDLHTAVAATRALGAFASAGYAGLDATVDREFVRTGAQLCSLYERAASLSSCPSALTCALASASAQAMINPRKDLCIPNEFVRLMETMCTSSGACATPCVRAMETMIHSRGPSLASATENTLLESRLPVASEMEGDVRGSSLQHAATDLAIKERDRASDRSSLDERMTKDSELPISAPLIAVTFKEEEKEVAGGAKKDTEEGLHYTVQTVDSQTDSKTPQVPARRTEEPVVTKKERLPKNVPQDQSGDANEGEETGSGKLCSDVIDVEVHETKAMEAKKVDGGKDRPESPEEDVEAVVAGIVFEESDESPED